MTLSALTKVAPRLRGVFTDIDDTLTNQGKLSAEAYAALWALRATGLRVVAVTGRPAGWCDAIARQWPVDAVVGENGAFAFYEHNGVLERLVHPEAANHGAELEAARQAVLREVPGARVAKDQAYRAYDLAIDFAEEAPNLGLDAARAIRDVLARHGAQAKISSIHVNGWFGAYDKLGMTQRVAQHLWGEDASALRDHYVFVGDSPNDEPMFGFFSHGCAVANIRAFWHDLAAKPAYVASREGGAGFAEIVSAILVGG